MDGILDSDGMDRTRGRLAYLAWRRYRIPQQIAEDLVQAAHLTYLQVRHRYARVEDHPRILVGVFRNKCREHIDTQVRTLRGLRTLQSAAKAGESAATNTVQVHDLKGDVLNDLVSLEDVELLLRTVDKLRPEAREMFRLILENGLSRSDLIRHYRINKNTLDSRLRLYRQELRRLLDRREREG